MSIKEDTIIKKTRRVTTAFSSTAVLRETAHKRPLAHGKVRLYPWEVCVLCVTSIPTVKLPIGNHYAYIKKNKGITRDISLTKS